MGNQHVRTTQSASTWRRTIERLLLTHRVHNIFYGYGYVFVPLRIGWFGEYRTVFFGASGWHRVRWADTHDCTHTGIY